MRQLGSVVYMKEEEEVIEEEEVLKHSAGSLTGRQGRANLLGGKRSPRCGQIPP